MARVGLIALVALMLAGCGGNKNRYLRKQAGFDLHCSEGQVHLSTISSGQFLAEACGRRAVYTYSRSGRAERISAVEGANVQPGSGPPTSFGADEGSFDVPPPPPRPPPPSP